MYKTNFISEYGVTASAIRNNDVFKTSMPIMATAEKIIKFYAREEGIQYDTKETVTAVKTFIFLKEYMESVDNVYTKINWKNVSETAKLADNMIGEDAWGKGLIFDIYDYANLANMWKTQMNEENLSNDEKEFSKKKFFYYAELVENIIYQTTKDMKNTR